MYSTTELLLLSLSSLAALAIAGSVWAWSWKGWLEFKRQELNGEAAARPAPQSTGSRIELADLRERVRKLEAIAAGVDM
jgi:hypothetical protein